MCNIIKELLLINIKKGGRVMLNKIRIVKDIKNQLINDNNFDKYEMTLPQIVD
ncbi:hypothetical protein AN2V17_16900 [Vallitalea sp. AN17-2]|uniref:Uncharacterized protein n=1 Tax=Vallitalea maricola TaxID=3074433 RepID=A0ACB5UKM4_9FIRM|nr:hypothetical protein AN2V17_16900 [Vallitalea sp. AN17-2]